MEYKQSEEGDEDMDNYMFHYACLVAYSLKMSDIGKEEDKKKILDLLKDKKPPAYKAGNAKKGNLKQSEDGNYEADDDEEALKARVQELLKELEGLKKPE